MKKIAAITYAIALMVCVNLTCSELKTFNAKSKSSNKPLSFAEKKLGDHAKRMVETTTYQHGSFEHIRDLAILSVLPTPISQGILSQQRNNMLTFLEKNEKQALEGVKNYWGFDSATWSNILEKNKKEHEFNLAEMRKNTDNRATYHNPSLPAAFMVGVQRECLRYGFNKNNFNLGTTDNVHELAHCFEHKQLAPNMYTPANVNFNLRYAWRPQESIDGTATHEFTHIIKGHSLLRQNIVYGGGEQMINNINEYWQQNKPSFLVLFNPFYSIDEDLRKLEQYSTTQIEKIETYSGSCEEMNLTAAQEKTADTYVICIDPQAAKNVPSIVQYSGYTDNHNDMKVIHRNWQATRAIEASKPLRRAIGSACGQQECTIL